MALPVPTVGQKLYFAYGSNLSLPQMAHRCPGSAFYGSATLHGYRWQINERGVANVVKVADTEERGSNDTTLVQGLLYLVPPEDEAILDLYEGVTGGFYQKHMRSVKLLPHPRYAGRPTEEVGQDLAQWLDSKGHVQPGASLPDFPGVSSNNDQSTTTAEEMALVYISEHYTKDGRIRDEYVPRMQIAVRYALALGVSQDFVDSAIAPHL